MVAVYAIMIIFVYIKLIIYETKYGFDSLIYRDIIMRKRLDPVAAFEHGITYRALYALSIAGLVAGSINTVYYNVGVRAGVIVLVNFEATVLTLIYVVSHELTVRINRAVKLHSARVRAGYINLDRYFCLAVYYSNGYFADG